jgi:hypothetical protein
MTVAATAARVLLDTPPFRPATPPEGNWAEWGHWPAQWVACPGAAVPFVAAFRRRFAVDAATSIRIHVTADERYDLWLDGERIGRGPQRGDPAHWFFETYDLTLPPGEHILVARVWAQGENAPFAQTSVLPGFLLAAEGDAATALLATGKVDVDWEARLLSGYTYISPLAAWGTGVNLIIDGAEFLWGWERGEGDGWQPVASPLGPLLTSRETGTVDGIDPSRANDYPTNSTHLLYPAILPAMMDDPRRVGIVRHVAAAPPGETAPIPIRAADDLPDEHDAWVVLLLRGEPLTIPPRTRRRVLWDLERYHCAYPEVVTTGGAGALVRVHWQEGLFEANHHSNIHKGNRNEIEGKYFTTIWHCKDGVGDTFLPDGEASRHFETLWWQCGRYVEILVETADEPLTLDRLTLRETRYPLEAESRFEADDSRLAPVGEIALRTLQMCAHETYMDCPYFEQIQYAGDTRLQVLTSYAVTRDDRLPRQALLMFDWSRVNDLGGFTQSRYPSRVRQMTWSFPLWWVGMVHDYALWRDDPAFVRDRLPGVRATLDAFRQWVKDDGLLHVPVGANYNFQDWVRGDAGARWQDGSPVGRNDGPNSVLNWQLVLILRHAAELEDWHGEPEMAARWRRHAREIEAAILRTFWDEGRGLFASDVAHTRWTEHAQCLALLAGGLSAEMRARAADGLLTAPDLDRTTIYYTHYLFEAYRLLGRTDRLFDRLETWFALVRDGLTTTIEMPEPTRSDCHAWGAHPLYHYYATLLGIRPDAHGFRRVRIAPNLGPLVRASASLVHPSGGTIDVEIEKVGHGLRGSITLPDGIEGTYVTPRGEEMHLCPGRQEIS